MTEEELEAAIFSDNGTVLDATRFRGLSLEDLEQRPEPAWVIYRLLPEDCIAMLEGTTASLKTFVALAFGYCVATGQDWLGRRCKQGRVLYLLGEGSRGLPRRARAWQIVNCGGRVPVDNMRFVVDQMPQLWKGDASAVLTSNPGNWLLIIVDTLARAMVGGDENLQKDMGLLIGGCEELRRATSACILILHHLNASGSSRGSTALPAGIHTQLRQSREPNSRTATLSVLKQKDDVSDPPIVLVARTVELGTVDEYGQPVTSLVVESPYGTTANTPPRLIAREIRALAALAEGPLNFTDWNVHSGLNVSTFGRARHRLLQLDYVHHSVNVYSISKTGQKALTSSNVHPTSTEEMDLGQNNYHHLHTPIRGEGVEVVPERDP